MTQQAHPSTATEPARTRTGPVDPNPSGPATERPASGRKSENPVASERFRRHPDDGWIYADPSPIGPLTRRALHTVIDLICPTNGPPIDNMTERIEDTLLRMVRYMQPAVGVGFRMIPLLLDWAPLWRLKALRPLHRLERAVALEVLEEVESSNIPPVAALMIAMRAAIMSVYSDFDEVHEAIGFRPLPFFHERVALRERLMAGGPATQADMLTDPPELEDVP